MTLPVHPTAPDPDTLAAQHHDFDDEHRRHPAFGDTPEMQHPSPQERGAAVADTGRSPAEGASPATVAAPREEKPPMPEHKRTRSR